jgi:hypothetical protein
MTTERQRLANRKNAARSTGPRTPAGKALVRFNSVRHGLRAASVVVPGLEAPAEWEQFRAGVVASLAPVGLLEETLADRAAGLLWRLRRVERFESLAVAANQAEREIPARPRSDSDALESFDDQDQMSDEEFLADREQALAAAVANLERYRPILNLAGRLPDLDDDAPVEAAAAMALLGTGAEYAVDEGADNTVPAPDDDPGLLRAAGLPADADPLSAAWTAGAVRKAVSAFAAAMKKKCSPARLVKGVAEWADEWVRDSEGQVELYAPEVDALRRRITLIHAVACVRRTCVDAPTAGQISRYEGHLQRQLSKALDELERLQQRRTKPGPGGE